MSYLFIGTHPISDTMETADASDHRLRAVERSGTLLPVPAQLETLRNAIDQRLLELETALEDPARGESLETLILDLSRLATSEAQAAAAHACAATRRQSDVALSEARAQAQASIDRERAAAGDIRKALEQSQQRLTSVEQQAQAELRTLREERDGLIIAEQTARADAQQASARQERALAEATTQLEQEKASSRTALDDRDRERDRAARSDAARVDADRAREEAQSALQSERPAREALQLSVNGLEQRLTALANEHARLRAANTRLSAELAHESDRAAASIRERDEALARADADRQAVVALQEAVQSGNTRTQALILERDTAIDHVRQRDVEHASQERALADADAQVRALEQRLAALTASEADLGSARGALTEELRRERERVSALEHVRAGLQQQLDDQQEAAESFRTDAARADDGATTLAADLAEARRSLLALRAEILAANADRAAVHHRVESLASERAALERARDEAEILRSVAAAERDELVVELEALRHERAQAAHAAGRGQDGQGEETELRFDEAAVAIDADLSQEGDAEPDAFEIQSLDGDSWSSVRLATRYSFRGQIAIQVNGFPAVLRDLSVCGCQVLADAPLKAGQIVRVRLPATPQAILCVGRVAWSLREAASGGPSVRCRAGIQFTQADEVGIETFTITHAAL